MIDSRQYVTTGHDGTELHAREWEVGEPVAVAVVVHGLGEHAGRHDPVGSHLAASGIRTHAIDLKGFGRSAGRRAHAEKLDDYHGDIEGLINTVAVDGLPLVLLGHSMGGLIALDYALSDRRRPDLLVLSAPAVGSTVPKWKQKLVHILAPLAPNLAMPNEIEGDQLSSDPAVGEAYFADPHVHTKTTLALARALLVGMARVRATWNELSIPTLVIHGGGDTVVPPYSSTPLGHLNGVQRVLFPTFRHELFNEKEADVALRTVSDWIMKMIQPEDPSAEEE
ncbi:MAG: alpha/beta hydrolase [Acidimicrobiia bacterium]|nr:alpha/beta hydrolase [Acidimicrobiia bacterium]